MSTQNFTANGLKPKHWSTASPIRDIFRKAFENANFPYYNPHSFRHTLVQLGYSVCKKDFEALKAWSQNLGHESMLTTLCSYVEKGWHRQEELLKNLNHQNLQPPANNLADEIVQKLLDRGMSLTT